MKFRLIEETLEPVEISADTQSDWFDIAGQGCDSIAVQMTASEAATPDTATIQLEASLDKVAITTVGEPVSVTTDGVYALEKDRPAFRYYRVAYAIASGSYTSTLKILARGDKE